jgi:thiol:disulfide interchange protein
MIGSFTSFFNYSKQMKQLLLSALILCGAIALQAQDMKTFKLYNPAEDAEKALNEKIRQAKASGKNVFVQIGGNWCIWCARFHEFITKDASIDSLINANYVVYHMNWSKENENDKLMARFGYPQRFGFPVFIVLDGKGNRLHTQNSAYLEEGKGYSKGRVMEFFNNWSPQAIDPATYKKK